MQEIMRTNDVVVLSFARSLLDQAGVHAMVADTYMSVIEGSIGMLPQRLLVLGDDGEAARRVLEEAGLGAWLLTQ